MVIWYGAIKTIQNGFFVFFLRRKTRFFPKKQKPGFEKTTGGCFL